MSAGLHTTNDTGKRAPEFEAAAFTHLENWRLPPGRSFAPTVATGRAVQHCRYLRDWSEVGDGSNRSRAKRLQRKCSYTRQKYFFAEEPATLTAYYIGTDLLEQWSRSPRPSLPRWPSAHPPGVTDDVKTSWPFARLAYMAADADQTGAESGTTDERGDLKELIRLITRDRITTQFSADAEWPWHDPASAGIRNAFHLPPGGPFTG